MCFKVLNVCELERERESRERGEREGGRRKMEILHFTFNFKVQVNYMHGA